MNNIGYLILFFGISIVSGNPLGNQKIQPGEKYCPACLDEKIFSLRHHYDDRRYGRRINIAQSMREYPCSEGKAIVLACPSSCLQVKMTYNDTSNQTKTTDLMDCGTGVVERLPRYENGAFMSYRGNLTILQKVKDDLQFTVKFFEGLESEEAALVFFKNALNISVYEEKWYRHTESYVPGIVAVLVMISGLGGYLVYRNVAEKKINSIGHNIDDNSTSPSDWEDQGAVLNQGNDKNSEKGDQDGNIYEIPNVIGKDKKDEKPEDAEVKDTDGTVDEKKSITDVI